MKRELAERETDGILVTLLWESDTDGLSVTVHDGRTGEEFAVAASAYNAMDVFHHPFAYAAQRGRLPVAVGEPVFA
jgi:carotenoid cleavage dioxygenase-like enzyme